MHPNPRCRRLCQKGLWLPVVAIAVAALLAGCDDQDETDPRAHYDEIMAIAVGDNGRGSDIDAFWRSEFPKVSSGQYEPPRSFHPYKTNEVPDVACERRSWSNNAIYCFGDSSISWDEDWLQRGVARFSRLEDMAPLAVIAHEWGHHIQNLIGRPEYDIQVELQADCFAGLYIAYAERRSEQIDLESGDVREALLAFFRQGDAEFDDSRWFADGLHGRPLSRALAFIAGFFTGDPVFCKAYDTYHRNTDDQPAEK